jgi:hypothetical protein
LPSERDGVVWPLIAGSLLRDNDWITRPEPERDIAESLEAGIRLLESKEGAGLARAKGIVKLLIDAGDLIITPSLMRSHVHKYGLAHWSKGRARPEFRVIYTQSEFETIIPLEAARYRAAIESGFFLKRAPDPDAIFFLSNLDLFDEMLKSSLTSQLSKVEAIGTFAALIGPPGFMSDRDTFERLIDCEIVQGRMEKLLGENAFSELPDWVQVCVSRFNKIIRGEDTYD